MPNPIIERALEKIESGADLRRLQSEVSRQLSLAPDPPEASLLHNLRGILHAVGGDDVAADVDFWAAHKHCPHLASPLYNRGRLACQAGKWDEAEKYLDRALSKPRRNGKWVLHALASQDLAAAMQGRFPDGDGFSENTILVNADAGENPATERLWARGLNRAVAKIASIPRYAINCEYSDVVAFDSGPTYSVADDGDLVLGKKAPSVLKVLRGAGYSTFEVAGPSINAHQACNLSAAARARGMMLEVWSFTTRMPGESERALDEHRPLLAGLAVAKGQEAAEAAAAALESVSRSLGVPLCCPDLLRESGNELGAARHRRAARRLTGG